ncbi:hypothetical protein [Bradyrhizobium cenepequi]|jgi:hypothetical protein
MSRISILNRVIRTTAAGFLFVVQLSPAHAAPDVFPDVPASASADRSLPTSHLPWLAPVGHRQPRLAEVPQTQAVAAWERQQQQLDRKLDRKLIICRGC